MTNKDCSETEYVMEIRPGADPEATRAAVDAINKAAGLNTPDQIDKNTFVNDLQRVTRRKAIWTEMQTATKWEVARMGEKLQDHLPNRLLRAIWIVLC